MIEIKGLHKSFGALKVLKGIDLQVPKGKTTVILGRSGGGKSVLLKHIIGLIRPDRGNILIDGVDITRLGDKDLNEMRKKFGMQNCLKSFLSAMPWARCLDFSVASVRFNRVGLAKE